METIISYCEATTKLASRFRHPTFLASGIVPMLHPLKSNTIYLEMSDNADAEVIVFSFGDKSLGNIYSVKLFVDDVYGETNEVFSWTTTVWQEVRDKILELKRNI